MSRIMSTRPFLAVIYNESLKGQRRVTARLGPARQRPVQLDERPLWVYARIARQEVAFTIALGRRSTETWPGVWPGVGTITTLPSAVTRWQLRSKGPNGASPPGRRPPWGRTIPAIGSER